MQIHRDFAAMPEDARGSVVAVGNFDGVHKGHLAVIAIAREEAERRGAPLGAVTFEPHPRSVFQPETQPFRLTPLAEKARQLATLGVDHLYVQRFDLEFSHVSADDFVARVLVDALGVAHVVTGYDFVFGHKRGGNVTLLAEMSAAGLFGFTAVDPVQAGDGEVYSSTRIRTFLQAGSPERAADLLGRPYAIEGEVLRGDQRGRALGFPTANLETSDHLQPAFGVYAVEARLPDGARRGGVANFGRRPTVDGVRLLLEVHLLDFTADLYGHRVAVEFLHFMRTEQKFDGLDALTAQIASDCEAARNWLAARA